MEILKNEVLISRTDYELIKRIVGTVSAAENEMTLAHELSRATIVEDEQMPADVIRLNSKIKVLDVAANNNMEFTLVLPKYADIKQMRISLLTPMGSALIGFKTGDEVEWKVPAGLKKFKILSVLNDPSSDK